MNKVRIIGGRWRGRQIHFPDVEGLRPSGDRIRETLFNWLQTKIVGAVCLDLFAGSGVLGFEALSRGAESVIFVDANREILTGVQKNIDILQAENTQNILAEFPSENLQRQLSNKKFDIIFVDPPFNKNLVTPALNWLVSENLLADDALVYIECEREFKFFPENFEVFKSGKAGNVNYYLLKVNVGRI